MKRTTEIAGYTDKMSINDLSLLKSINIIYKENLGGHRQVLIWALLNQYYIEAKRSYLN